MNLFYKLETDRKIRENKVLKIYEGEPSASGIKLPSFPGKTFNAFKIPLEVLIFNHLNDRFASRRREYISINGKDLSADDIESQNEIMDFIWDSNFKRNQDTLSDILKNGQQKYGVITRDGRIIDGNRRVRILKEIYFSPDGTFKNIDKEKFKYFEAVILPYDIDENELQLLETKLQMGEDEKVDYNPTEKYLKIDKLKSMGLGYRDIAGMISSVKTEKKAIEMHQTYKLMCEYLKFIGEEEKFSLIDKMEDHFLHLSSILNYYESGTYDVSWNPDDNDILELKTIAFNYIRTGYEGKDFRFLMGGQRNQKGIFSNKQVWDKFKEKHNKYTDDLESKIKSKSQKKEFLSIEEKESFFKSKAKKVYEGHLKSGKEALENKSRSNEPKRLAEEALDKIDSIDEDFFISNFDKTTYKLLQDIDRRIKKILDRVIQDVYKKSE